jgi:hypothetical protein
MSATKDSFGVKKLRTLQKTSSNCRLCVLQAYKKITSQTIKISGALVFLCTGANIVPVTVRSKIFRLIIVYCFFTVLTMF